MQQVKEVNLPTIFESRQKASLSPFTWNNLTLPPLSKAFNSAESKANNQKQPLKTITQAKPKTKNITLPSKKAFQNQEKAAPKAKNSTTLVAAQNSNFLQKADRHPSKSRDYKDEINKTIDVITNNEKRNKSISLASSDNEAIKNIKVLDKKCNMERYMQENLTRNGWRHSKQINNKEAHILWANTDKYSDHLQIKKGQFYNHIQGSASLTYKDRLHEEMQVNCQSFYPRSFLIPKEYQGFMQENNHIAVKSMLRHISLQIFQFFQAEKLNGFVWNDTKVHIGEILQSSIPKTGNSQINMLIKMCMYLQNLRFQEKYTSYFQKFQGYFKVNIRPKANLFQTLLLQASHYLDYITSMFLQINYKNIDYRLLVLILHYDHLYKMNQSTYDSPYQLWIVKPVASSRGAGISIIKSSSEFCSIQEYSVSQFKNRKKYQNKIIQIYITNPYILPTTLSFANRKFDVRQWVLVVSGKGSFTIYRYHTAYCRFASQKYDCNKLSNEVHLTNFSLFKSQSQSLPSIMMIQQLFQACKEDLRAKYVQQATEIIQAVVLKSKGLKYQEGCFQLFGFDFLIDSYGKLFLLEINLNPSCSAERYQKLKVQSQMMVKTMIELVTQNKRTQKWVVVAGSQPQQSKTELIGESQVKIKPFYQCCLDEGESLIALIRNRRRVLFRLTTLIKRYFGRQLIMKLKGISNQEKDPQEQADRKDDNSNEVKSHHAIRFIEERSLPNL